MIDDDEFPIADWLRILLMTCRQYRVDGVLGPVKRHFDREPPPWLKKSSLYDRRVNPTGLQVNWKESRTGNVLLKRYFCPRSTVASPLTFAAFTSHAGKVVEST